MNSTPPVFLLIFNRPGYTKQVMEQIRQAESPTLLVGADGSRADHLDGMSRIEKAREVASINDS